MPQENARRMKDVLRCPEKQHNYNENDIRSIYEYALGIEGKTFLDILREAGLSEDEIEWVKSKEADKGLPGKIVEASYFGYELNSRQEADFERAGAELKTTAADYDAREERYRSGETISVTQIDLNGPIEADFLRSHLYDKLKMLIVIFYHRDRLLDSKLLYNVFYASLFEPSEEDLAIIRRDFYDINQKIQNGLAHTLSRSDGIYLGTAPRARNASNLVVPYYGGERMVKRSYTLRKEYVNVILSGYYTRQTDEEHLITDIRELERMSFAEIIQDRFAPYIGRTISDIALDLDRQAGTTSLSTGPMTKATTARITAQMLGLTRLRSEEFTRSGIVVKTITFNRHGTNTQKFRLGDADFMEINDAHDVDVVTDGDIADTEIQTDGWETSELYSMLDSLKYLLVVFQEDATGDLVFKGSKLWAMSDDDIELAHQDWTDIKRILAEGVQLTIGTDGRTYNNFPGVADAHRIHLRPHGEKAFYVDTDGSSWGNGDISDTELLPDGRRMTRQSYWLNNSFIKEAVRELVDNGQR